MAVLIRWIGIPLLLLAISGPLAAIVFASHIKHNHLRWLWVFCLGLVLLAAAEGIFIAHTLFVGLFPDTGCFMALLTPVASVVTFLVFRRWARQQGNSAVTSGLQDRWYLIGIVLIPLLQLAAPA